MTTSPGVVDELPVTFADSSEQIATGCAAEASNTFVVTGRSGLPEDPSTLRDPTVWQDLRPLETANSTHDPVQVSVVAPQDITRNPNDQLVEATGWEVHPGGQIKLVAATATEPAAQVGLDGVNCGAPAQGQSPAVTDGI